MFETFTAPARIALYYANVLANRKGVELITPQHLAVALLTERTGGLQRLLAVLGVNQVQLMSALDGELTQEEPKGPPYQHLLLDEMTLHAVKEAVKLAKTRGEYGVGPAHLLFGLLNAATPAAAVLQSHGVTSEKLWPIIPRITVAHVVFSNLRFLFRDRLRRLQKRFAAGRASNPA